jgi:nicotinamide-nucleotide amidase
MLVSPPAIELLAIGNELLLGETVDTNSAWIAQRLAREGIAVARKTTVGDDVALIRDALSAALRRARTVVCTGGLGPTVDDLTRHAVAELYGRRIVVDESWIEVLRERYRRRGIEMPAINRVQGEVPEGARALPNPRGTAPAIVIEDDDLGMTVLLPGVPSEMRGFMEGEIVPLLCERLRPAAPIAIRLIRTTGISEAAVAERVADIAADTAPVDLAFLPDTCGVDIRLSAASDAAALRRLDALAAALRERIGAAVYADGPLDLAAVVGKLLRARRCTVALAESCTGGLLGKRLTDTPGASDYVQTGFITYSNQAKHALLGVSAATLAAHGAVSGECAREMAAGARLRGGADLGVAITGIAGPGGGTEEKPVGTTWIAVAAGGGTTARRFVFPGDRGEVRERAAQAALDMLRRHLLDAHD